MRRLGRIALYGAVIAGEDARFCRYHGFDWGAIETAWNRYESGHGRLLGASTISMQTAKNVFLWPGRDWLRKAFEAWFTLLIKLAWGKHRIMQIHLNVVEWGPGICGAEAAARYYFAKQAAALTEGEAVRLAAVLFPIRSTGHRGAQNRTWSPAAPGSSRIFPRCPPRGPCPAAGDEADRFPEKATGPLSATARVALNRFDRKSDAPAKLSGP